MASASVGPRPVTVIDTSSPLITATSASSAPATTSQAFPHRRASPAGIISGPRSPPQTFLEQLPSSPTSPKASPLLPSARISWPILFFPAKSPAVNPPQPPITVQASPTSPRKPLGPRIPAFPVQPPQNKRLTKSVSVPDLRSGPERDFDGVFGGEGKGVSVAAVPVAVAVSGDGDFEAVFGGAQDNVPVAQPVHPAVPVAVPIPPVPVDVALSSSIPDDAVEDAAPKEQQEAVPSDAQEDSTQKQQQEVDAPTAPAADAEDASAEPKPPLEPAATTPEVLSAVLAPAEPPAEPMPPAGAASPSPSRTSRSLDAPTPCSDASTAINDSPRASHIRTGDTPKPTEDTTTMPAAGAPAIGPLAFEAHASSAFFDVSAKDFHTAPVPLPVLAPAAEPIPVAAAEAMARPRSWTAPPPSQNLTAKLFAPSHTPAAVSPPKKRWRWSSRWGRRQKTQDEDVAVEEQPATVVVPAVVVMEEPPAAVVPVAVVPAADAPVAPIARVTDSVPVVDAPPAHPPASASPPLAPDDPLRRGSLASAASSSGGAPSSAPSAWSSSADSHLSAWWWHAAAAAHAGSPRPSASSLGSSADPAAVADEAWTRFYAAAAAAAAWAEHAAALHGVAVAAGGGKGGVGWSLPVERPAWERWSWFPTPVGWVGVPVVAYGAEGGKV
ncbi:hypothetical protein HDU96_002035 [Phlyctochytrium bullatum]|nr:hypothetical protein HDU96_002035 [Phlyctochytrium bullatum]